jgi:hypothetical protein
MSRRVPLFAVPIALAGALALSGCGPWNHADPAAVTTLSPRALSSLTNYRARLTSGSGRHRMMIRTQVHSPDNWAAESGFTVLHIGRVSYVHFGNRWFRHREQPNAYAQSNLPAFARQLYAMTRLSGAIVRRGGPCREAGLAGRTWTVRAASGATFGETFTACVANGSGALLKLVIAARGVGLGDRYASEVYEITAVGRVPPFQVPAPLAGR